MTALKGGMPLHTYGPLTWLMPIPLSDLLGEIEQNQYRLYSLLMVKENIVHNATQSKLIAT